LIFLALAISLFLWYRRLAFFRKGGDATGREGKSDIPAPAETVLNRPDPTEKSSPSPTEPSKVRVYSTSSSTTIDLDPESQNSSPHAAHYSPSRGSTQNPFDDNNSIQTAGTEGTNVIPIALVSPESHLALSARSQPETTSTSPIRPARSPDLNLNLEHVNVSRDSLQSTTPYAPSQRSGISGVSSRISYMSAASYSSDFLHEAPMIMAPTKGAVRQVVGVVKAEVINTPGPHSPSFVNGLKPPPIASRPSVGSPLASGSFGPADVVKEGGDDGRDRHIQGDPFGDEHSTTHSPVSSPSASVTTFGLASPLPPPHNSTTSDWVPNGPNLPWTRSDDLSRPSSISTQAGSIVDIGSATRVNVGLHGLSGGYAMASSPLSAGDVPRSPYRNTMGKLVSPSTSGLGTLQEQQQRALAHAQARAQAQGLDRRVSGSSVLSSTSTRADSILESFPFVPPSPISDRPIRTPPVSPLAQQSFSGSPTTPLSQSFSGNRSSKEAIGAGEVSDSELPAPPDRRMLGLSTSSQFSTASSGLGSFPFHIDSGNSSDTATSPSAFNGRQRASLDTLAITSDLSSYPLGFDRDSRDGITASNKS